MSAFLSDGTINLRPVSRADLPQLAAWRNDPELRARTREFRPLTDVDQERWLAKISGADRRDFIFVVEQHIPPGPAPFDRWIQIPIGVVGLCHWDAVNASAEVSFYIGDEAARGKGYASRAIQMLCRWGFDTLRLHRIWAEVYSFNEPSVKLLARAGFVHEGTLRQHVWKNGRYHDAHIYGAFRDEMFPPTRVEFTAQLSGIQVNP